MAKVESILEPLQNIRKKLGLILSTSSKDIKKNLIYFILGAFEKCEQYAQNMAVRAIKAEAAVTGLQASQQKMVEQMEEVNDYVIKK